MTHDEAEQLAAKRERHKGRSLRHKRWAAVHDSVKGWHVALVVCPAHVEMLARQAAKRAFETGDLRGFMDAASQALLARCAAAIAAALRQGGDANAAPGEAEQSGLSDSEGIAQPTGDQP